MIRFIISFLAVYIFIALASTAVLFSFRKELDMSFTRILSICLIWPLLLWKGDD